MNIKLKFDSHRLDGKKTLVFVSLLFMVALVSSSLVSVYSGVSPFALGDPDSKVKDAAELETAITNAPDGEPCVIAITNHIILEKTIVIPAGKNITLVSDKDSGFYKLSGADGKVTVTVESGAELVLAGIIVTHVDNARGTGVEVNGKLTMTDGEIFNNNVTTNSGGVYNNGDFKLTGGAIYNNTATNDGGGIYNDGNFDMTGGTISGNSAKYGGGVYNNGESFTMSGGEIYNNKASADGGGIYNDKSFTMSGGKVYRNIAENGGGVYVYACEFKLSGGEISNNTANINGGGLYTNGNFTLSNNGLIFNNVANRYGGGVYNDAVTNRDGVFIMSGGIVANNTATDGGGMYIYSGSFEMTNGRIANNTATRNGGGIGVPSRGGLERLEIFSSAIFSNNVASAAYNRSSSDDDLYRSTIGNSVTWTGSFKQGYNNYDIYYVWGSEVDVDDPTTSTSPSPSASSSPTSTVRPTYTANPTKPPTTSDWFDWRIIVILALIIGLVVAVLVFYIPRRGAKQIEEDLGDFTVV